MKEIFVGGEHHLTMLDIDYSAEKLYFNKVEAKLLSNRLSVILSPAEIQSLLNNQVKTEDSIFMIMRTDKFLHEVKNKKLDKYDLYIYASDLYNNLKKDKNLLKQYILGLYEKKPDVLKENVVVYNRRSNRFFRKSTNTHYVVTYYSCFSEKSIDIRYENDILNLYFL